MELLLNLYPEWVRNMNPLNAKKLEFLLGQEGSHDSFFRGGRSVKHASRFRENTKLNGASDVKTKYSDLTSFLPNAYKFSTFVQLVLNDEFNCDVLENFGSLMTMFRLRQAVGRSHQSTRRRDRFDLPLRMTYFEIAFNKFAEPKESKFSFQPIR